MYIQNMLRLCDSPRLSTTMRPSLSATVSASSKPSMCIRGDDDDDAVLPSAATDAAALPSSITHTIESINIIQCAQTADRTTRSHGAHENNNILFNRIHKNVLKTENEFTLSDR